MIKLVSQKLHSKKDSGTIGYHLENFRLELHSTSE